MTMPPLIVQVAWRRGWPTGLWIPVFLLWSIAAVLVLPLALIGTAIAAAQGWLPRFAQGCTSAIRLVCELRGLRIEVVDRQSQVSIRVY